MTIENFIKSFLVKWVDIYNYDRGEYIYNGPSDKLPKEYKKQKVLSFSFSKKRTRINISYWTDLKNRRER